MAKVVTKANGLWLNCLPAHRPYEWKHLMNNEPQPKQHICTNSVVSYKVFISPAPPVAADCTGLLYNYFSFILLVLFIIIMAFGLSSAN